MLNACTTFIKSEKVKTVLHCLDLKRSVNLLEILIAAIVSFVLVILFIPSAIRLLKEKRVTGTDVHKLERPEIPKGGGYVILFAIVFALLVIIGLNTFQNLEIEMVGLFAALVSILMAGLIGLLDDNLDFRNRTKVILPLIASIPMVAMSVGTPTMTIPFIGTINFGIAYALLIVPLMMTFIIDATNMYAGMNGLEAGLSAINASGLVLYIVLMPYLDSHAVSSTQIQAGVIAAALLGASLGFLVFNKYPAKILSGDVGNLPMGAAMAAALIIGNMDRLAVVMYIPFAINFLLYIIYRIHVRQKGIEWVKFAQPREDGTLEVVGPYTIYWVLPHFFRNMTERKNVAILLLIQAILVYSTVLLLIIGYPLGIGWI
jgi:UDP-N-acetylglucosamine--dolichyl-phosphate N-acetylglucosaminephosphotransferase